MQDLRSQGVLPPIHHSLGYVIPTPVEPRPQPLLQGAAGVGPAEVRLGVGAGAEEGPGPRWLAAREEAEGAGDDEEAVRASRPHARKRLHAREHAAQSQTAARGAVAAAQRAPPAGWQLRKRP
jgi:hypothetical protein